MTIVAVAIIECADRRILIGQRRRTDTSPLKWEFPGGKVQQDERPEAALARELREELGATLVKCVEIGRTNHRYATTTQELEVRFYAASIESVEISPRVFEQVCWVLPRELGQYDFLAANAQIVARLATGIIKPSEVLGNSSDMHTK